MDGAPQADAPVDQPPLLGTERAGENYVDDNEAHRQGGLQLVGSLNVTKIPQLRIIAGPLAKLLHTVMKVGGRAWELEQRKKAVEDMKAGRPVSRLYRATIACEMTIEEEFFRDVKGLISKSTAWEAIHPNLRDVKTQGDCFAMIARSSALVHELLRVPHDKQPIQMFRLLEHHDEADHIFNTPKSRKKDGR